MSIDKNTRFNGFLIALYLLQFPFLIPFSSFIDPKLIVSVISSVVCILIVLKNLSFKVVKHIVLVYFALLFLICVKWLVGQADEMVISYFIAYVTPVLVIFLYPFDCDKCIKSMFFLSKPIFILLFWIPFTSLYYKSYMRFGYGMLYIVILAYFEFVYYKSLHIKGNESLRKAIDILIFLVGSIEIFMYGSRGATFCLIVLIILDNFFLKRFDFLRSLVLLFTAIIGYFNIGAILDILGDLANSIGVRSYAIIKFKMQLLHGFEKAASGRVDIYESRIEYFLQNPLFGGKISFEEQYAHNFFLQVGSDFGVLAVIIVALIVMYSIYLMSSNNLLNVEKVFLLFLFIVSFGRLTFSSTIWQRPEFWMLVFFLLTRKYSRSYNCCNKTVSLSEAKANM